VQPAEPTLQQEVCGLYRDHHHWLKGWLQHKLDNAFDAADLAQDVFVRLLTRQELVAAREPKAFLSTIARRLVVEHWRRRELELAWLETLAAWPEAEVPSPKAGPFFWKRWWRSMPCLIRSSLPCVPLFCWRNWMASPAPASRKSWACRWRPPSGISPKPCVPVMRSASNDAGK